MSQSTIKDVADLAHVSSATVSRVLNKHPYVTEDVRRRVLEAVRALGYQPNRAARRLRANSSDILGLIIPDIQNPFFLSVVRGIEDTAYLHGMNVILCNTDDNPDRQEVYLRVLQAEQAAGLLVVPTLPNDGPRLASVREAGMPIVLMDRETEGFEADIVKCDNVHGAYLGTKHLLTQGYRRVAIIAGTQSLTPGLERLQGSLAALAEHGIKTDHNLIKVGNFRIDGGYELAQELMASEMPPDAVFACNNMMTLGALRALHELGIHIPDQVALVGFDDMPWADDLLPPLTTVAQPGYELGQQAMDLMLKRITQPGSPFRKVLLQPKLKVRQSCGARVRLSNRT
jgi:DNA-binding LacI/PurR family transcriptional regulator